MRIDECVGCEDSAMEGEENFDLLLALELKQ
jgi:hypothetical protein